MMHGIEAIMDDILSNVCIGMSAHINPDLHQVTERLVITECRRSLVSILLFFVHGLHPGTHAREE